MSVAGHSIPELGHFWRGVCQKGDPGISKSKRCCSCFLCSPAALRSFSAAQQRTQHTYTYKACMYLPTDPISHSESD